MRIRRRCRRDRAGIEAAAAAGRPAAAAPPGLGAREGVGMPGSGDAPGATGPPGAPAGGKSRRQVRAQVAQVKEEASSIPEAERGGS